MPDSDTDQNHDAVIRLCSDMSHVRIDLTEIKQTLKDIYEDRKVYNERLNNLERHVAVHDTRWKIFTVLASIIGSVGVIAGIISALP